MVQDSEGADPDGRRAARYRHSPSFAAALGQIGGTLLVSTYQAGQLIAIGVGRDGLRFSFHTFDQAMGVAARPDELAVGARRQVWRMTSNPELAPLVEPAGEYDALYLTRTAFITGRIQSHELAWGRRADGTPELWVVNTAFSCLATLDPRYSFVPRWRPAFVTALAAEDRCHLNGVAMRDGRPSAVTVMGRTDEPGGWRVDKRAGGCVLDVHTGEVMAEGLSMPHSPRWSRDRLLVLNSGHGTLETIDPQTRARDVVASLPGFTRGLAVSDNLAFVGLSRIRETAVFGGLPIQERDEALRCGIAVVELTSGRTVATLEFESGIEEIFDVQWLPGQRCTALGGSEQDREVWVVPQSAAGPLSLTPPPAAIDGWVARGLELLRAGRAMDGAAELRRALAVRPESAEIANHLGNALQEAGDGEGALGAYRAAVTADPGLVPALQNLGHLLAARGETREALARLRAAQALSPSPLTRLLIATTVPVIHAGTDELAAEQRRGDAESQALVDDGVVMDTTERMAPTNFYAAYQGRDDRPLQERLGQAISGPNLTARGRGRIARAPDGRVRVGFLSAYFRDHTIGRLNLGRIQRLDRDRFEVVVLSSARARDPFTAAFQQAADRFVALPREVAGARALVAAQELDGLIFADVGMDPLTTTLAHSRMAPVQAATWGHPVTTGSPMIDWFISSDLLELEGAERHYTERLLRLSGLGTWYERPPRPPTDGVRSHLGLSDDAHVYVCPQTLFKLHPDFDAVLGEILRRDPQGVLVLIEGRHARWGELVRERFERVIRDVTRQIHWLAPLSRPGFLALVAASEVMLDPLHFGGGNSSYEALAMGTPIVTLPGELLRGRITRALYAKAGYEELVVDSAAAYVELAVQLGTDPGRRERAAAAITKHCAALFEADEEVSELGDALAAMCAAP